MSNASYQHLSRVHAPRQERSRRALAAALDAFDELLRERPLGSVTMQEVADRAGLSITSVYARFEGKAALVLALHEQVIAQGLAALEAVLDDEELAGAPLESVVAAVVEGAVGFAHAHAHVFRAVVAAGALAVLLAQYTGYARRVTRRLSFAPEPVQRLFSAQLEALGMPNTILLRVSPDVERDVSRQFAEALKSAEVRKALSRPEGAVELWREKRFEIVLGDAEWISGAFDRVTIHRAAGGCVTRAEILDYKSNRVESESQIEKTAEGYRPQLSLYGRALARILAVPSSAISLRLLFTRPARVYDL